MEAFIFNELREKGFANGITIFKVDDNCKSYKIYYYDGSTEEECSKEYDSYKESRRLVEKTIEVNAMTSVDDVITKIKLQNTKRPPFGITPRFIWIEQRIDEIIKAMDRYREAKKEIPKDWYFELAQLETEKNKSVQNVANITINTKQLSKKDLEELENNMKLTNIKSCQ